MIYTLLVILVIIFIIVIFIDKDIFSPSAMICESYILAVTCAIYNIDTWKINLSSITLKVIIVGILSFVMSSAIIIHVKIKNNKKRECNIISNSQNKEYKVRRSIYNIFVFSQIITALLYIYYVAKVAGGWQNFINFEDMMNYYRESTYDDVNLLGIPFYVRQLFNISKAVAYISAYDLILTFLKNKKYNQKNNIYIGNLISIPTYILNCLFSGGRYGMVTYILGILLMWKILNDIIYDEKNKIEITKIIKILLVVIVIIIVFSKLRYFVGRTNDANFIDYITTYFGRFNRKLRPIIKR